MHDLVFYCKAAFMYDYFNGKLPEVFLKFVTSVKERHNYITTFISRSTFSIPKVRTNYGKFNVRFSGAKGLE